MESVNWGIVGCGDVTEKKSGPGLQRADHSELVAVMRRDTDKAKDYAARHGVPMWYSVVEDLILDSSVTAVYIATPPGAHLSTALQVAAARKPCYLEKPMARNAKESLEIASAFQQAGVPLFVAYYRRAYPRYLRLKALLESGTLGELSMVHYSMRKPPATGGQAAGGQAAGWRHDVASSGGGLFVDVGSHLLDLLDFLLGPLRDVQGVVSRSPDAPAHAPEDTVAASFVAGRAIVGSATWNFRASESLDLLEFVGDKGRAIVPEAMNGTIIEVIYADGSPGEKMEIPPPSPSVQEPLIQTVVEAIRLGEPSHCPSTAESALRTAHYIDAVLAPFYAGRDDAFWERPQSWSPNV